jgi:predicted nucleic acid-binding protein|tara:strand:+ start:554 stop:793 length:240 start_codon:yes stop_codon:yes gene_type:complete
MELLMKDDYLNNLTADIMKKAYKLAEDNTKHPDDSVFVANAFLNTAKILYTEALGEDLTKMLFRQIVELGFDDQPRTIH